MHRVFFRNLAFLVSLNLVIKPIWIFGIDRTVQNVVGASGYGIYFVLTNLSLLTQIILDLGISSYNNRLIAQQEHLLTRQLSHVFSIKLILSGIYLLITVAAALILNYTGHSLFLLFMICVNQILASLITYVRSNISALHHFKVDSTFSVMDKALMILICGTMLYVPSLKSQFIIDWFVYAQLVSYLITLAGALIYVLNISGKIPLNFSFSFSIDLLKSVFPFALLIALMMIYGRIDGVMIEKLLPVDGEREAGLYASAFRLIDAFNQFGFLFSMLLLPIFSRMISTKQNIERLAVSGFTVIHISAVIICTGTWFFAGNIMHLLYTEGTDYSAEILRILMLSILGSTTIYIFSTLLTASNNLRQLIYVAVCAVILNFLSNRILIPHFKALGSAMAAATTQIGVGCAHLLISIFIFKFHVNKLLILKIVLFAASCILIFWIMKSAPISWLISLVTGSILCVLSAFVLRLVEVKKITGLILRSDQ
ncbi:MAG: polysaccharide biosynthesis C-terminal domain-containing protein [Chitinophagales bacterium]